MLVEMINIRTFYTTILPWRLQST